MNKVENCYNLFCIFNDKNYHYLKNSFKFIKNQELNQYHI